MEPQNVTNPVAVVMSPESILLDVLNTLKLRASHLETLDQLLSAMSHEHERFNQMGVSLKTGLELMKRVVDEREAFFNLSLDILCIATTDGYFHKVNRAFERTLGHTSEELLSKSFIEFVHPDDRATTREEIKKLLNGIDTLVFENRYLHKNGSYRWLSWTTPAPLPGSNFLYAVARDITLQREQNEKILYQASHDDLTGLENRARFHESLALAMARVKRTPDIPVALLFFDLDRFKPINDQYGHQTGDFVLQTIAARLKGSKRESDILCRLGGDEFALIAEGADVDQARIMAERMRDEIRKAISIGQNSVDIDVSIGIAMTPASATEASKLVHLADQAMYQAKKMSEYRICVAPYLIEV